MIGSRSIEQLWGEAGFRKGKAYAIWHESGFQIAAWLERLYARLEDEYELKERAEALNRKLGVIADSAQVLTDIVDTRRSLRLERIIVFPILFEVLITVPAVATRALSSRVPDAAQHAMSRCWSGVHTPVPQHGSRLCGAALRAAPRRDTKLVNPLTLRCVTRMSPKPCWT